MWYKIVEYLSNMIFIEMQHNIFVIMLTIPISKFNKCQYIHQEEISSNILVYAVSRKFESII